MPKRWPRPLLYWIVALLALLAALAVLRYEYGEGRWHSTPLPGVRPG